MSKSYETRKEIVGIGVKNDTNYIETKQQNMGFCIMKCLEIHIFSRFVSESECPNSIYLSGNFISVPSTDRFINQMLLSSGVMNLVANSGTILLECTYYCSL